jgi:multidrug efflux system outer membrane protein
MLLSACSLEPKYVTPIPAVPQSWPAGSADLRAAEAGLPTLTYRDIFRDPKLQAIIARALAANQDLRIAMANVEIARGTYRIERAARLPQIDLDTGVTRRRNSSATQINPNTGVVDNDPGTGTVPGTVPGTGTTVRSGASAVRTTYTATVGASFELDLFGRLRSLSNAALDEYFATEAGVRAARLTLVADVAAAYLTLAADRSLLLIAADTSKSAARSMELTRLRLRGGIAPRTELRQAETVLAQAQADEADLSAQVVQDRNALELLVGGPVPDAELPPTIEAVDPLVAVLPAGLDSRVLLRRPDVVQAEYSLRAANARIGAARAAFFPQIGLTAAAGLASTALGNLFTGDAFNWSAGPSLALPIFDGGANRGNLQAARGRFDLALATWQRTVQQAFRDVADQLARAAVIDRQAAAQQRLTDAAQDTLNLQQARYREGIDPYLNTLDAQRTLYSARRALVQARLLRATNRSELYRALGGDELTDVTARR